MKRNWTSAELIAFEDRIGDLYLDNKLPFLFHLSGGNDQGGQAVGKAGTPGDDVLLVVDAPHQFDGRELLAGKGTGPI